MKSKALGILTVSMICMSAMGLNGCVRIDERSVPEKPVSQIQQQNLKKVSGEIIDIDEDSFSAGGYHSGSNFQFENIRIKGLDGKILKLVYPGPANYLKGDKVEFEYKPMSKITHQDLLDNAQPYEGTISTFPRQKVYLDNVDGLIEIK